MFRYKGPPEGETHFPISDGAYDREVRRCLVCGHFVSVHDMDLDALYDREYVESTYGAEGLWPTFERIVALPPERSDNAGRVERVDGYARARGLTDGATLLDVGSGLAVFPFRMQERGWLCTALDPDPRAVCHAEELGLNAVCADFRGTAELGPFHAISFNKVLEHVVTPADMLANALRSLRAGGFVYVEVPDGEAAVGEGPGREEFFIEHHHVFSAVSLAMLAVEAGFRVDVLERLREPSTKFTLRAFLSHGDSWGPA